MRKRTYITHDEMDVKKIFRDELEKAKPEWIEEIVERVSKNGTEKFDKVMTTLDKMMGKFESHDQEHTIIGKQLDDLSDRTETIEEQLKKFHPAV